MIRSPFFRVLASSLALWAGSAQSETSAKPPTTLTLEEALRRLDAQSLTLAQARSRAEESKALVRQASSALLPTLGAAGAYTRNNAAARISFAEIFTGLALALGTTVPTAGLPTDVVIQPLEAFNGSVTVRAPIFSANTYSDVASARHSARASEQSAQGVRLQVRSALIQAAYSQVAVDQTIEAAERALATAAEHAASAERSVRAGTAAPLTKLQADTEVVRRESELVQARSNADQAYLAMGALLGRSEAIRVVPPVPQLPVIELGAMVAQALDRRPEVGAAQSAVLASERQVDSAWWRLAPRLSASFSYFASTMPFPTGDKTGWNATADLSWPLYDGGFRYGKRRQAEAALAGARAALEQQRVDVAREVKDAARGVEVAQERLRLAEKQNELAQETAQSAQRSFDAGLAGSLDVIDANDRAFQAEVGLAGARAQLGVALASLDRAMGEGT
jgi:outer membrane protein TolC